MVLTGVHPDLVARIDKVLAAMSMLGHPMKVVQGLRTTAQQQALYAQGRTAPGRVVTKADGVLAKSNHQAHVDGLGHAVDCAFQLPDPFDEHAPWSAYGACVQAVGLVWGGTWTTPDRPHAELP